MLIRLCDAREIEEEGVRDRERDRDRVGQCWCLEADSSSYSWRIRGNICDCDYLSISYNEKIIEGAMNAPCNAASAWMCRALRSAEGKSWRWAGKKKLKKEAEVAECKKQQSNPRSKPKPKKTITNHKLCNEGACQGSLPQTKSLGPSSSRS